MKIAPLYHALSKETWATPIIVHTGQHYDINMSDAFFNDLNLPDPHIHLGVGSGTHAEQTGNVMMAYEKVLMEEEPDLVVVVGDVNSTMACTIAASKVSYSSTSQPPRGVSKLARKKNGLPLARRSLLAKTAASRLMRHRPLVAHLEAGLRSFDRTMPEEINRLVTDGLADILWTPSPDADDNLVKEGLPEEKIHMVGNIMIDSLEMLRDKIESQNVYEEFNLDPKGYGLVTLHRPSNVDDPNVLEEICQTLTNISKRLPLIFPIHPRTKKTLEQNGSMQALAKCNGLHLPDPIPYIQFMNLLFNCSFVITDSGGIQEETTYLGIPCLTLRPNTERPITISQGTNQLCEHKDLEEKVDEILLGKVAKGEKIKYWDGKTADRIVECLRALI